MECLAARTKDGTAPEELPSGSKRIARKGTRGYNRLEASGAAQRRAGLIGTGTTVKIERHSQAHSVLTRDSAFWRSCAVQLCWRHEIAACCSPWFVQRHCVSVLEVTWMETLVRIRAGPDVDQDAA